MYVLTTIQLGLVLAAVVAGTAANGADHQLQLQLPVNCAMATVCDVQNYFDHGNGWETQYSHMRRSSVRVKPGEPVYAGQILGDVGMSGNAEFPHLHFEVRHNGVSIDPFTGLEPSQRCGTSEGETLWGKRALANLDYPPAAHMKEGNPR